MRHRLITSLRWLGAGDGQEAPMLPPRLVRRLVAAPLVVAIAAALAVLAPPVAILTVAFNGNWTPQRWRRSVAPLRRQGLHDLAERAVAMPHVLAPRGGGALAAFAACPAARAAHRPGVFAGTDATIRCRIG
jgi:hypothetical protein